MSLYLSTENSNGNNAGAELRSFGLADGTPGHVFQREQANTEINGGKCVV